MEALIERSGDVVVVHLRGRVDYESTEPFRIHCARHLSKERIIFNLKDLSFVGSVGITDFVATVGQLIQSNQANVKFANVGNEFRRIFEASDLPSLMIYETTDRAMLAFQGLEVSPLPRLSIADEESPDLSGV